MVMLLPFSSPQPNRERHRNHHPGRFILIFLFPLFQSYNGFVIRPASLRLPGINVGHNFFRLIKPHREGQRNIAFSSDPCVGKFGCGKMGRKVNNWLKLSNSDKSEVEGETAENERKLSVAVVGSGAVGCFYGARLWETGVRDVKFLMRGEHLEACQKSGLQLKSVDGDLHIPADSGSFFSSPEEIGKVDWVLVCLKSTGLEAVSSLAKPLFQESTRVLAIMNGLVDDDLVNFLSEPMSSDKQPSLPCKAIYGGMALLCSNRIAPGKIDHTYAGELASGVAARANSRSSSKNVVDEDKEALEELWRPTNIKFTSVPSLVQGRWTKNCWNLPFNGVSVAMGGITVDKICTDPGLRRLADSVMNETIAVANADLKARGEDPSNFLGQAEKEKMWNLSDTMGPYKPSTMLDLLARKPMEVKYLFQKPLDHAKELNVSVPNLEVIVTLIEAKQRIYNLF